jgi:hypothetical protein
MRPDKSNLTLPDFGAYLPLAVCRRDVPEIFLAQHSHPQSNFPKDMKLLFHPPPDSH